MVVPRRALVTEAEFLALPESVAKTELLDGEVVVAPSPSFWHQEVLLRLVGALRHWSATQAAPFTVCQAPLDVRFGDSRILQPDAFVVRGRIPADQEGPITLLPLLCVEVLSANRVYDRVTKRLIYAAAGVPEYWVVEPAGLVERWQGEGLAAVEEIRGEVTSDRLPGLSIDLSTIFARPDASRPDASRPDE